MQGHLLHMQVGLTMVQLKRVLRRQATSLTYTAEHWTRHIAYFTSLGIDAEAIPQVGQYIMSIPITDFLRYIFVFLAGTHVACVLVLPKRHSADHHKISQVLQL